MMEKMFDFLRAALSLITCALLSAVFFARKDQKYKKIDEAEGMCFGTVMSRSFGKNMVLSPDMLSGLVEEPVSKR